MHRSATEIKSSLHIAPPRKWHIRASLGLRLTGEFGGQISASDSLWGWKRLLATFGTIFGMQLEVQQCCRWVVCARIPIKWLSESYLLSYIYVLPVETETSEAFSEALTGRAAWVITTFNLFSGRWEAEIQLQIPDNNYFCHCWMR